MPWALMPLASAPPLLLPALLQCTSGRPACPWRISRGAACSAPLPAMAQSTRCSFAVTLPALLAAQRAAARAEACGCWGATLPWTPRSRGSSSSSYAALACPWTPPCPLRCSSCCPFPPRPLPCPCASSSACSSAPPPPRTRSFSPVQARSLALDATLWGSWAFARRLAAVAAAARQWRVGVGRAQQQLRLQQWLWWRRQWSFFPFTTLPIRPPSALPSPSSRRSRALRCPPLPRLPALPALLRPPPPPPSAHPCL